MMVDKVTELSMRSLMGDQLTEEELEYLREYKARYEIVRYVYMDKVKNDFGEDHKLTGFHFTPSDSFMETPVLDTLNELMRLHQAVQNGEVQPLNFDDLNLRLAKVD